MDYKQHEESLSLGIVFAMTDPATDGSSAKNYLPTDSVGARMRTRQQPLRISVVFDQADSAGEAEVLIRHDVADISSQTGLFRFEKPSQPETSLTARTYLSRTNIRDLIGPIARQMIRPSITHSRFRGREAFGKEGRLN